MLVASETLSVVEGRGPERRGVNKPRGVGTSEPPLIPRDLHSRLEGTSFSPLPLSFFTYKVITIPNNNLAYVLYIAKLYISMHTYAHTGTHIHGTPHTYTCAFTHQEFLQGSSDKDNFLK